MRASKKHFVYILQCADNTLYTGYTTDTNRRLREHNDNNRRAGARYTRTRTPVTLVYKEIFPTRSTALKREMEIKKMTRQKKQSLFVNNKKF